MGDVYANVPETVETVMARINEVYECMLLVEQCGASPELTAAVLALGERERALRIKLVSVDPAPTIEQRLLRIERALERSRIPAPPFESSDTDGR